MPSNNTSYQTADLSLLLKELKKADVDFILVGGVAAVAQGAPVTTFDLDIVHCRSTANIEKIKKGKTTEELLEFGIINIDKSSGPTSFNVSHYVKKKLNLRKTSHFGTLDPKVTGVLPVSLNRACKLMGFKSPSSFVNNA